MREAAITLKMPVMRDSAWSALICVGAALAGFGLGVQVFVLGVQQPPRPLALVALVTEAVLAWSTAVFWRKDRLALSVLCLGSAAFLLPLAAKVWR